MKNAVKESIATRPYLSFGLGEETFAVDVVKTREILDVIDITRVPQTPEFMLGVINLRGGVVPVIDLRLKFGLPKTAITRDTCIIVVEVAIDGEITVVGVLTDSVREVLELAQDQIEPPPRIGTRLKTEFIKGMGNLEGEFLIILDIDRIFSSDELVLVKKTADNHDSDG
jgi:purine-binding chemotaxis protein CheW